MEELHLIFGVEGYKLFNNPFTGILSALKRGDLNNCKEIKDSDV